MNARLKTQRPTGPYGVQAALDVICAQAFRAGRNPHANGVEVEWEHAGGESALITATWPDGWQAQGLAARGMLELADTPPPIGRKLRLVN